MRLHSLNKPVVPATRCVRRSQRHRVPAVGRVLAPFAVLFVILAVAPPGQAQDETPVNRDDYFQEDIVFEEIPRYQNLPTRFLLRPEFYREPTQYFYPDTLTPFFVRLLEGDYDADVHVEAARSLERIARENYSDPKEFEDALRTRLKNSEKTAVVRACATALVAVGKPEDAELLSTYCLPSDDILSSEIESWLIAQESKVLLDEWKRRVRAPRLESRTRLTLACRGLAATKTRDMAETLAAMAGSDRTVFAIRVAAADAVAILSEDAALKTAKQLQTGTIQDQITGVRLLGRAESDSALQVLEQLCDAREDAVASVAWQAMLNLDSTRLTPRLKDGISHRDANVRSVCANTAGQNPSAEHCDLLNIQLGDTHIAVRNLARRTLQQLAKDEIDLTERILTNAGDVTARTDASWEQLEQCLYLLGFLKHDVYQPNCIALLQHERPEVMVSAAWLLHIMPQDPLGPEVVKELLRKWDKVKQGPPDEIHPQIIQIGLMSHVVAYTKADGLQEFCEAQFKKDSPLLINGRAIAMWTLGRLQQGSRDDRLRKLFTERVFDDDIYDPEHLPVKCGSAVSLGLLESPAAIPSLRKAHVDYGTDRDLGKSVSTALKMLGEEVPTPKKDPPISISDWPILPLKATENGD